MGNLVLPYTNLAADATLSGTKLSANFQYIDAFLNGRDLGGNGGINASNIVASAKFGLSQLAEPKSRGVAAHIFGSMYGVGTPSTWLVDFPMEEDAEIIEVRTAVTKVDTARGAFSVDLYASDTPAPLNGPSQPTFAASGLALATIAYDDAITENWGHASPPLPGGVVRIAKGQHLVLGVTTITTNLAVVSLQAFLAFFHVSR